MRPRVHPRAEALDDQEATAAAGAGRRRWLVVGWLWVGLIRGNWGEQDPDPGDVGGPGAAGEQAVVADAVEAVKQDVKQEAADELVGREGHALDPLTAWHAIPSPIVLPAERHAAAVEDEEPAVRDRDPMGVAGQVGQHGLGSFVKGFGCRPVRDGSDAAV